MRSLIYLLSTRADLFFAEHKLANFSSNPGKVNIEGLLHLLRYIRDNNNLDLRYYAKIEDAPLSNLFREASINNENRLMVFYDSILQDCPDTGRITGSYIVFYQGIPIYHCTHVRGPVAKSSDESD